MSSGKGGRKFTGPPPTTRSNKKAKLEHSTTSVNSRALDTTTTAAGENLWTDIDNRLFGTAADESQVFDSLLFTAWESVKLGHTTTNQAADLAWLTLTQGLGAKKK